MARHARRRSGSSNATLRTAIVLARIALAVGVALMMRTAPARAQPSAAAAPTAAALPDPIYWRQNLFLIPYQWTAATDPGGSQSVWLYVSKDRGANWQKISEARPQVRAFNYHAEADGEYWFAIRTTDGLASFWPAGPIEPELRVIVDTTIPRFETLAGVVRDDGTVNVEWRVADANLDARSWLVEVQTYERGEWQTVAQPSSTQLEPGIADGRATTQISGGGRALAVRVAAADLAGNRAVSQASVSPAAIGQVAAAEAWPSIISGRSDELPSTGYDPAVDDHDGDASGWVASGAERSAGGVPSEFASLGGPAERRRLFAPLEPFRQRSDKPWESTSDATAVERRPDANSAVGQADPWLWLSGPDVKLPPDVTPKLVNSRTFMLEYELEDVGPWGVAKVELWGTRDGGRTWRNYATDSDHASPLQVTVGEAGLYGFRIVVSGGGGVGGFPPQPGDQPELWVGVDLHRPEVELTGAKPGSGEFAGHLLLGWWADDDNLDPRPIGLFYSSRPVGPWTAIATNLANTGEYPWRLERHLPPRVYLRLEARDSAGNLAAYQTYEPVSIELPPPSGRIESVESLDGPTAWSGAVSPR